MRWVYPFPETSPAWENSDRVPLFPELLRVGHQKYAEAYPIHLHSHNREYEFVYLQHGNVTWEVDSALYPMSAGQWFFTRPGELHKARFNHMEPGHIWWMILTDPECDPNWFRLDKNERQIVIYRLQQLPRVFRADPRTHEHFARLKQTLISESPEKTLFARYQLLDILLRMLQPAPVKTIEPELRDAIVQSVEQMAQVPEQRLSVSDMARAVQISESHYFKLFHEVFGQSPASYMDRIRIERACKLLQTDASVTDIAMDLGYKTSQHFTKVFRKITGSSPSEWRRGLKST